MFEDDSPPAGLAAAAVKAAEREAHYAAIGRVAANWAFLEQEIDDQTVKIGAIPKLQALCLTAQVIGPARKLDALFAVANLYEPPKKLMRELETVAKEITSVAERRNRVVHDPWLLISPKERAFRFEKSARRKLKADLVHYPTRKVAKLAEEIDALTERLSKAAREITAHADALRRIELEEQEP